MIARAESECALCGEVRPRNPRWTMLCDPCADKTPDLDDLRGRFAMGEDVATCGCTVRPGGYCTTHSAPSWLRVLGLV